MATSDAELQDEVRDHLGYNRQTLSDDELRTNISRAKSWIVSRKASLGLPQDIKWYADGDLEESLFWYSCLFSKMTAGEVDVPSSSVGNINVGTLSADETQLYQQAKQALSNVGNNDDGYGITRIESDLRGYGSEEDGNRTV